MDYRICFVLSAFWMLTHGLTLQPCHNGFELTLGSVNTITCSEVKDNAVVTWRYSMGKDTTGHLAGECQGFSSSGDNSCGSALLKPKIVPHRVSQASSTLKINAGVNMEPGFVSCATPGELVKCDFDVVWPPAAPRITCSPKGYLREGQPLTCSCSSTSLGLPRGVLKLSKVSGNHEGLKSDVPHTSRDDGATLLMAPYNVTSEDHMSTSFHCDVMWANVVPGDTYTVQVGCAPRLPGNTDHPSLVKFSGQRVQHTFDVIAYPPPRLHDITVLDLKTVRFIADKTGSDLNVTCSHTNIRLYLSSCTMDISNISLPLKASAIYKVTLANELGHVEHSVNIVNERDRDIFSGPRRNRNMRAEADEGFVTNLSSNTQCAKQGSCSLEDVYEVTDGYNNYTNNSLSGRPARRVLDDDDGEYISCT